ncbi:hypothetical protein [Vallitalea sp.]|jgi:hypothetical protein|uniref:hypothetical protein n=1 Tax=Vallitalea sp. TaxID=1882829 RepID=UPI0025E21B3B|nr:hypothetical protein [Vallitalea sp.]MCT4685779.1 hypothetical protein [Vallitalea sp.]
MFKKSNYLLIFILFIIIIIHLIKPIKYLNYSNIDRIVIINVAEKGQDPLTLSNNDFLKLKNSLGKYSLLTFTTDVDKVIYNLRMDLYDDSSKKYSMYLYSDNINNNKNTTIYFENQYYKINYDIIKTLEEILIDNNFNDFS